MNFYFIEGGSSVDCYSFMFILFLSAKTIIKFHVIVVFPSSIIHPTGSGTDGAIISTAAATAVARKSIHEVMIDCCLFSFSLLLV